MAIFVPEAGMVCCSLRHRGEGLLGQRGGLRSYVESGSTMGIPSCTPGRTALGRSRFELAGRRVDLELEGLHLKRDGGGLPINGLLTAARGWRVERHLELGDGGVLAASFDFGDYPRLLEAFPFPHRVEIEATLRGAELTLATTLRAEREPVPIAFGFHPYLRLPGVERAAWELTAPVRERLRLNERMLPTGTREPATVDAGLLGTRTFDDPYLAPDDEAAFALAGAGGGCSCGSATATRTASSTRLPTPTRSPFEPMTAPTDALLRGEGLRLLPPGESFTARFSVLVGES